MLPLTGDANLIVIRHTPSSPDDVTLSAMEEGIRAIEGLMAIPFPFTDFILLVVEPDIWQRSSGSVVGGSEPGFYNKHILVNSQNDFHSVDTYKGVIYHELGHLLLDFEMGPRWLGEGSPEFLRAYTRDEVGTESIEQRLAYLQSVEVSCDKENLQQHMENYRPSGCDYYLGEKFLLAMFTILGETGVSAALRDVDIISSELRSSPHDYLIYLTFAKYVPPGKREEFQAAYRRYHGGPIITIGPPSPDRRIALTALYNATSGSGWEKNDNWLEESDLSEWYGVTTAEADQVAGLMLGYNEMGGGIPPELGRLTNLVVLDLSSNELTGAIPSELGLMTNLRVLNLGDNQLTGEIPPELGALIELEDLFLGGSPLTGTIPPELGSLAKLERLYIVATQLSGKIPPELGNLTNLRGLRLEANLLTGEIPPELGRLTQLRRLELHDNLLSGEIPPELGALPDLRVLNISGNRFTGCIPEKLREVPTNDLEELGIPFCGADS